MSERKRRINGELSFGFPGAAELIGYTIPSLRAKVRRRLVPFRRDGGRIIFLRSELEAWLQSLPGVTVEEAIANGAAARREAEGA